MLIHRSDVFPASYPEKKSRHAELLLKRLVLGGIETHPSLADNTGEVGPAGVSERSANPVHFAAPRNHDAEREGYETWTIAVWRWPLRFAKNRSAGGTAEFHSSQNNTDARRSCCSLPASVPYAKSPRQITSLSNRLPQTAPIAPNPAQAFEIIRSINASRAMNC